MAKVTTQNRQCSPYPSIGSARMDVVGIVAMKVVFNLRHSWAACGVLV